MVKEAKNTQPTEGKKQDPELEAFTGELSLIDVGQNLAELIYAGKADYEMEKDKEGNVISVKVFNTEKKLIYFVDKEMLTEIRKKGHNF